MNYMTMSDTPGFEEDVPLSGYHEEEDGPQSNNGDDSEHDSTALEAEADRLLDEEYRLEQQNIHSSGEDPVRMYLTDMGQIPLLTREEEIMHAKRIEASRIQFRRALLMNPRSLDGAIYYLQKADRGELRLDRHFQVSQGAPEEKKLLKRCIAANLPTIMGIRERMMEEEEEKQEVGSGIKVRSSNQA